MHPLVVAHFQAVHSVIHEDSLLSFQAWRLHQRNRFQPENPSETTNTLQPLIASPLTLAYEKAEFRKILDYLVVPKEIYGLALRQSEGAIAAFDLAPDALRAPFVQDLRKGSSYSLLRNHICRLLSRVF